MGGQSHVRSDLAEVVVKFGMGVHGGSDGEDQLLITRREISGNDISGRFGLSPGHGAGRPDSARQKLQSREAIKLFELKNLEAARESGKGATGGGKCTFAREMGQ